MLKYVGQQKKKKKIKRSDLNVPGRRVAFSQFANVQDRT